MGRRIFWPGAGCGEGRSFPRRAGPVAFIGRAKPRAACRAPSARADRTRLPRSGVPKPAKNPAVVHPQTIPDRLAVLFLSAAVGCCDRAYRPGSTYGGDCNPKATISRTTYFVLPLLGGPQCAKRTSLTGQLIRGGLGKPLGRGEGGRHTVFAPVQTSLNRLHLRTVSRCALKVLRIEKKVEPI